MIRNRFHRCVPRCGAREFTLRVGASLIIEWRPHNAPRLRVYKGPASVVLSESEVKSLTTMLSDPPFASTATMKAARIAQRNFTKRCNTHTCAHRGQRPMPPSPLPLFWSIHESGNNERYCWWPWNFVCDLDTGLIVLGQDGRSTNEDLCGIFLFWYLLFFFI